MLLRHLPNLFQPTAPLALLALLTLAGCTPNPEAAVTNPGNPLGLTHLQRALDDPGLQLAAGLGATIVFQEGDDLLLPNGDTATARGKHDYLALFPDRQTPGQHILWCNHEMNANHDVLGDGGGGTLITLRQTDTGWVRLGLPRHVDFGPVGGTMKNCLGAHTPWGTVLTSEETSPANNAEIYKNGKGFRDTSDFGGYPRYLNFGWQVEIDPQTGQVLGKRYAMGRFGHEGSLCLPDSKTVYMMDDATPGIFFKFVADQAGDLSEGQLYAYQQGATPRDAGRWLPLPRHRDSLNHAREVAARLGATLFIRLEDLELGADGRFYITETGHDAADLTQHLAMGANLAHHLQPMVDSAQRPNTVVPDPYGRLLVFDPATGRMAVHLQGGAAQPGSPHPDNHFSNPDNLAMHPSGRYLVIHEDLNGSSHGRVPDAILTGGQPGGACEAYLLDLNLPTPTVGDLVRLAVGSRGSETTGGLWTPDGETFFMNLQHTAEDNPAPWHRDATVAITGFATLAKGAQQPATKPAN